jgi:hypothetical protein
MVMPQQLTNLTERGAPAQHLAGQSVTKLMRAFGWCLNCGAFQRMLNNGSDTASTLEPAVWRFGAQKDAPTGALWSPTSQICGDRFANFWR